VRKISQIGETTFTKFRSISFA